MAKAKFPLGHADWKEKKYLELLTGQLRVNASLVAMMDAIAGNRRLEGAIDVKSDLTGDPSKESSVKHDSTENDGARISPTESRTRNESTAKSDVTDDSTDKAKPGKKVRKLLCDICLAGVWALIFLLVADWIKIEAQSIWDGAKIVVIPVKEFLRILATFWIL